VKAGARKTSMPGASGRGPGGLRARLADAEETIRAIRNGEIDAVVVADSEGEKVFTLEGAGHAYRALIESMNEGALTLKSDTTVLYANRCFAGMARSPLERIVGGSFGRFLFPDDIALLEGMLKRPGRFGRKLPMALKVRGRMPLPVQISVRALPTGGLNGAALSMVVTDLTEARRSEDILRALNHRVVRVQDTERGRVAQELHDNITQLVCAVVFRSQILADRLTASDGRSKVEAIKLREMLGGIANEIERISHDMGPGVLDNLGLVAVLRTTSAEFADRTGLKVRLAGMQSMARLSADTEIALYRILQEALRNVEKHARASNVSVSLRQKGEFVRLLVRDDGIGYNSLGHAARGLGGLGLASMRERAAIVGGSFKVRSNCHPGTEIEVQMPRRLKRA